MRIYYWCLTWHFIIYSFLMLLPLRWARSNPKKRHLLSHVDRSIVLCNKPTLYQSSIMIESQKRSLTLCAIHPCIMSTYEFEDYPNKLFTNRGLIHLFQYNKDATEISAIPMSVQMKRRLTRFLSQKPWLDEMKVSDAHLTTSELYQNGARDCLSFVRYLLSPAPIFFKSLRRDESTEMGDIIFMKGKFGIHVAMILIRDICIYKLGVSDTSPVVITDLESAKRAYCIKDDEWKIYRQTTQEDESAEFVINERNAEFDCCRFVEA